MEVLRQTLAASARPEARQKFGHVSDVPEKGNVTSRIWQTQSAIPDVDCNDNDQTLDGLAPSSHV